MFGSREDGGVISLAARRAAPAEQCCFREVESYWTALAAGRIMPLRDEVDPRGIAGSLAHIFLVERIAEGAARFRIAGNHLTELMGMDVRGMPLSCLFTPPGRVTLSEALRSLFDDPARVEFELGGPSRVLRGRSRARMLLLPLRDRHGRASRAIGAMATEGPLRAPPQRFDITGDARRTLLGYGNVSHVSGVPTESDVFDRADRARDTARRTTERRPDLRVVSTNAGE